MKPVSDYIEKGLTKLANLDKRMQRNNPERGYSEMAKRFRETYSYRDKIGSVRSIRIEGKDRSHTDLKFQSFLMRNDDPSITLAEFVDQVYRPSFMQGLSPTTQSNYEMYLRYDIIPFFGDKQMVKISVADIQQFYNWMAQGASNGRKNDLTYKTIERVSGFLNRIFKVAKEMGVIFDSPIKKTLLRNNGAESRHHEALPDDKVVRTKQAIQDLKDPRQKLYMGLLVYTGLRREEILGLRWEHINLEDCYGEVRQVVVYPNNGVAVVKDKAKTPHSKRFFVIPEPLREILMEYWQSTGFILYGRDPERPLSISTVRRVYTKAFEILGISDYTNHDWRATYGTQLKEMGVTSAQVADMMGHADTRMVETVYAPRRLTGIMKNKNAVETLNSEEYWAQIGQ